MTASGEDLATTSDIVTDALTAFGLTAADSGHFADVLGDQKGQQGDLVIPVYLGNQLLDEVIVTAQQRMSLRSGG